MHDKLEPVEDYHKEVERFAKDPECWPDGKCKNGFNQAKWYSGMGGRSKVYEYRVAIGSYAAFHRQSQ